MKYFALILAVMLVLLVASCSPAVKPNPNKLHSIIRLHDLVTGEFFCSGVVISDKLAFTAAHCLSGRPMTEPTIIIQAHKDSHINVLATVAGYDTRSDQGIITGDFSTFYNRAYETAPGILDNLWLKSNKLITCGFPYGGELACSRVTDVSHFNFQFSGHGWLYPGMSGGPIIDLETGKVIGVNTAVINDIIVMSPTVNIFDNLHVDAPSK